MKKVGIGIAAILVAAGCTLGGIQAKKGIDNYVKKQAQEIVTQYEQKDKQWTKENFQEEVSLKQLQEAFNSTYIIMNETHFTTGRSDTNTGSGILLKGGYLLTAKHVVERNLSPQEYSVFDHFECYTSDEPFNDYNTLKPLQKWGKEKKYKLEKIVVGLGLRTDYALLKIKDDVDLPFYSYGLNMPENMHPGMSTVLIGFPLGTGRNLRFGNLTQTESDAGENYLTMKNDIQGGDSGGPVFGVNREGGIELLGLVRSTMEVPGLYTNIHYMFTVKHVIEDLELQLESGRLDEKTAKEVKNFLELNKK